VSAREGSTAAADQQNYTAGASTIAGRGVQANSTYGSCNLRIINRRNSSLFSSRSVDNGRRSPGKLRLSSSCNMRIGNRRNSSLSSSRRRSAGNLPLSSRCNKYSSLCNRRSPGNLHCRRGTRPGNLCLKMRFLTVLLGQNKNDQNTSLVHLCCQKQM
jgi:hypothetical protein